MCPGAQRSFAVPCPRTKSTSARLQKGRPEGTPLGPHTHSGRRRGEPAPMVRIYCQAEGRPLDTQLGGAKRGNRAPGRGALQQHRGHLVGRLHEKNCPFHVSSENPRAHEQQC